MRKMADIQPSVEMSDEPFKMPSLPANTLSKQRSDENPSSVVDNCTKSAKVDLRSPAEILKDNSAPPLQYREPPWSGIPPVNAAFYVEELKGGTIVKSHELAGKAFFVVGRLPSCDIQLEHPSLSRYHAVLQYRAEDGDKSDQKCGFYLYDLGSTHGSFHNKNKCFPKTYYRVRVGHGLKFGGSTRLLILQGPEDDMEDESELSVTELKELAAAKAKKRAKSEQKTEEKQENSGINWGMADDAQEDDDDEENPDMSKNPFGLGEPKDESLYLDDPKKSLRGWFEREGFELEYDVEEKGYAQFVCKVNLPIGEVLDAGKGGSDVVAEATVKGKKKEAVVQCALEACRILDRYGLLRQSNQESKAKRIAKKWKDDDYYDSDEDEFLDRTGTIAAKRRKRMQLEGEAEPQTVDTYETLVEKSKSMAEAIREAESQLAEKVKAMGEAKKLASSDTHGDIDSFMAQLKKTESGQGGKEAVSRLKQQLAVQRQELAKVEKLVNIARPTQMPKLQPTKTFAGKNVLIGKRWGFKGLKTISATNSKPKKSNEPIDPSGKSGLVEASANTIEKSAPNPDQIGDLMSKPVEKSKPSTVEEKSQPNDRVDVQAENDRGENSEENSEMTSKKPKAKNRSKRPTVAPTLDADKHEDEDEKVVGDYSSSDPKYATWVPPENQTGDGRTSLNDKYGY